MSQSFINLSSYINYTQADKCQEQEMFTELEFINQIIDQIESILNNQLNRSLQVFNKSENGLDYVTEADHKIEEIIRQQIKEKFPNDLIVGEESGLGGDQLSSENSKRRWFVDPIDGTMNFVRGIPEWCVSIACQDENGLRLAAIADLAKHEIFTAARGQGAFLNEVRLEQVNPPELFSHTIYGGFIERGNKVEISDRKNKVDQKLTCLNRSLGSAALSLAYTAAGRFDTTYFECPIYDWDVAAGILLCAETGCQAEMLAAAKDGFYPRMLAASQPLFSNFKQLIE